MSDKRLKIYRGQDKSFIAKLRNKNTGDSYSLDGATLIQIIFRTEDGDRLVLSNTIVPAIKAQAEKNGVLFTSGVAGVMGNGIALTFNGVDTYDDVVLAWNTANPTNPVLHNALDGLQPVSSGSIQLEGGYPEYQPVVIWGNPIDGKIQVNIVEKETFTLRTGSNHSFTTVVDKGDNPSGIRNVGSFENKVDIRDAMLG